MEENRSLTVKDDAVNLPVLHVVQGESDDFRSLVKEAFPPAISVVVCEIRKESETGHSRLGILVTTLFCVAVLGLSYRLWPRPLPPVDIATIIVKDDTPPPTEREFAKLAIDAQKLLDYKKYNESANLLLKELIHLDKTKHENLKLFVLYCSAVIDGKLDKKYSEPCKYFLEDLQDLEPDDIKWQLYWLILESKEALQDFEKIESSEEKRLKRIQKCVKKTDHAIRRDGEIYHGKNKDHLSLIMAQLLTAEWLLKGADEEWPDNEHDPGVYEREEAYKIASQKAYKDYMDFINLRIFILDKLYKHIKSYEIFNRCFFDGRYCTKKDIKGLLNKEKITLLKKQNEKK